MSGCAHPSTTHGLDSWRCESCGLVRTRETQRAALARLGAELHANNPHLQIVTDDAGVWVRHGGTDYAYYAAAITFQVVQVWEHGITTVHRPTPAGG
jgi:hypothetical protein